MSIPIISCRHFWGLSDQLVLDPHLLKIFFDGTDVNSIAKYIDPPKHKLDADVIVGDWLLQLIGLYRDAYKTNLLTMLIQKEISLEWIYNDLGAQIGLNIYIASQLQQKKDVSAASQSDLDMEHALISSYHSIVSVCGIKKSSVGEEITPYNLYDVLSYRELMLWVRVADMMRADAMHYSLSIMTDGKSLKDYADGLKAACSAGITMPPSAGHVFERELYRLTGISAPSYTIDEYNQLLSHTYTGSLVAQAYRRKMKEMGADLNV